MRIGSRTLLALVLPALLQLSCATVALVPERESMPAARLALHPGQRVFYDALQGYGDWLLIEPLGYVFRPYDSDETWHPYLYGYWAPSDVYGWVWISGEPYGWATYHYGAWYFDDYQGWVWIPGDRWGPAWVAWEMSEDYVGWAPLPPRGYAPELAPDGGFLYVPLSALAATDLPGRVRTAAQLGVALGTPVAVDNLREQDGVVFNAGPPFPVVERRTGPLARVTLEDLAPAADGDGPAAERSGRRDAARGPAAPSPVRRTGEEAARQARAVTARGGSPPPVVGVLRPELRDAGAPPAPSPAPPDSGRRR